MRIHHLIAGFTLVDERVAYICLKLFSFSLIWAHSSTEDKEKEFKYTFYKRLELENERYPRHILVDFDA